MIKNNAKKALRVVKKVFYRRKEIPRVFKERLTAKIRPYVHKTRNAKVKADYGVKLILSRRAREQHRHVSEARSYESQELWGEAAVKWREIIKTFEPAAPVEAYVKLARIYQLSDDLEDAKQIISRGVEAVNQSQGDVGQNTLYSWLELSREKANINILERLANIDDYRKQIKNYQKDKQKRPETAPKIAIVSAVSGGYDAFHPPHVIDSRFDYIVYSDTLVSNPGIYDVRLLPYIDTDSTRSARFVKTNIKNLLPDYDYVMWIDANILITGDIHPLFDDFIKSDMEFSAMLHPVRTSPFEEMEACIKAGKDDVEAIREQRDYYKRQVYDSSKLIESNILFYKINGPHVGDFLKIWWNQIDMYSRRDQFSINYALDTANVDWTTFTDRPDSSRNHPSFALMDHGRGSLEFHKMMKELDAEMVDPFKQAAPNPSTQKPIQTITAVVCVHNAPDDTRICLESIAKHREPNLDLVIVDDGSDEPAGEVIDEFAAKYKWVRVLRHKTALGYTRAASAGLKESKSDMTILLNSDTVVTKGWATSMAITLDNNPGAGIVGPLSSAASHQSIPDHTNIGEDQTAINGLPKGLSADDMAEYCSAWSDNLIRPRVPLVHGFCYGVRREVIETIGYLDAESFPRGYGEENDYCFRAANAGFGLVIATDTYVFHSKSKSFVSEDRKQLMQTGAEAFRDLHGQRRITRAVETMQNNPILQRMRIMASDLYRKQELENANLGDEIVMLSANHTKTPLRDLDYHKLQKTLVSLNNNLIEWSRLEKLKRSKEPTVSIVVLVLDNLDMTIRCIKSVMEADTKIEFELLVVNNGCTVHTMRSIQDLKNDYPEMRIINIEQNLNFALGNNVGFGFAKGKYSVFLNNDTYVTDGWLDKLIEPLETGTATISQSLLVYPDGDVQSAGIVFGDKVALGYALYAGQPSNDPYVKKDRMLAAATGACIAMSSRDFASVKGFDPHYINGQEDTDLCLRVSKHVGKSRQVMVVGDSIVYHDESRTPGRGKYRFENREIFLDRWQDKIEQDDHLQYDADGFEVTEWRLESHEGLERGVPIYVPNIRRL